MEEYLVQGRAEAWYHSASPIIKGREEEEEEFIKNPLVSDQVYL